MNETITVDLAALIPLLKSISHYMNETITIRRHCEPAGT